MYGSSHCRFERYGKPCADQRALQADVRADANALAVELRAFAARGREQFLAHRVVHDRVLHAAATLHADRDCELRKAVQVIRGAVERVDDPHELVVVAALAAFLGEEGVLRIKPTHGLDDVPLRRQVDLGDEVVLALGAHFEAVHPVDAADDDLPGAQRGFDGDVQQRLHAGRASWG